MTNPTNRQALNPDGTLTCRLCGEAKPTTEFHRNRITLTGLERVCKPCAKEKAATWRATHKQGRSQPHAEQTAAKRARRASGTRVTDLRPGWRDALIEFYGACLKCGGGAPFHADHVVPLSRGGVHFAANLQLLCRTCNLSKHARTEDYRNGVVFTQKPPSQS